MRWLVAGLFLLALSPASVRAQRVGLPYGFEHNLVIPGPFTPFTIYVEIHAETPIARLAISFELPPEFIYMEPNATACDGCVVELNVDLDGVRVEFPGCLPAGNQKTFQVTFITLVDTADLVGTLCVDLSDSEYEGCDGGGGALSTVAEHSCSAEVQPRCLWVNELEPCGLAVEDSRWGTLKTRWTSPG